MSAAGRRSLQGYDYQIRVATHWLIRLLEDDDLDYIQAEVMALPGDDQPVAVDDVVITFNELLVNAGLDQDVCDDFATLSGSSPGSGTGLW